MKDDLINLSNKLTKEVKSQLIAFAKTAAQDGKETNQYIKDFSSAGAASNKSNFTKLKNRLRFLSKKENPPEYAAQLNEFVFRYS